MTSVDFIEGFGNRSTKYPKNWPVVSNLMEELIVV